MSNEHRIHHVPAGSGPGFWGPGDQIQGDCAHLPRGIVHSFRNTGTETARMLVTATPAGIEKFFEEAFSPAVEGKEPPPLTPELIAHLMAASARHGQTVLPPAHR